MRIFLLLSLLLPVSPLLADSDWLSEQEKQNFRQFSYGSMGASTLLTGLNARWAYQHVQRNNIGVCLAFLGLAAVGANQTRRTYSNLRMFNRTCDG